MNPRYYCSRTGRPTLEAMSMPIIGGRRPRTRPHAPFWLASVTIALLVGFVIGLMI